MLCHDWDWAQHCTTGAAWSVGQEKVCQQNWALPHQVDTAVSHASNLQVHGWRHWKNKINTNQTNANHTETILVFIFILLQCRLGNISPSTTIVQMTSSTLYRQGFLAMQCRFLLFLSCLSLRTFRKNSFTLVVRLRCTQQLSSITWKKEPLELVSLSVFRSLLNQVLINPSVCPYLNWRVNKKIKNKSTSSSNSMWTSQKTHIVIQSQRYKAKKQTNISGTEQRISWL